MAVEGIKRISGSDLHIQFWRFCGANRGVRSAYLDCWVHRSYELVIHSMTGCSLKSCSVSEMPGCDQR